MYSPIVLALPILILPSISWSYFFFLIPFLDSLGPLDVVVVTVVLGVASVVVTAPLIAYFRSSPLGGADASALVRLGVVVAPAFEIAGRYLSFLCLRRLPAGDAVTIIDLCVVWMSVGAALARRKLPSKVLVGAVTLVVVGVVLMTKPQFIFGDGDGGGGGGDFPDVSLYYFLAFLDSLAHVVWMLLYDRLQKTGVHFSVLHVNYAAMMSASAVTLAFLKPASLGVFFARPVNALPVLGAVLLGTFDLLGRLSTVFALRWVEGDIVAVFMSLEIPISYALAFWFLGQTPDAPGFIGAGLIFVAICVVTVKDVADNRVDEE